jgi:hypothetical protein
MNWFREDSDIDFRDPPSSFCQATSLLLQWRGVQTSWQDQILQEQSDKRSQGVIALMIISILQRRSSTKVSRHLLRFFHTLPQAAHNALAWKPAEEF